MSTMEETYTMIEKSTIDLAISNLDKSSRVLLDSSLAPENYNTDFGKALRAMSHEMWCLARKMKDSKETDYVLF